MSENIIEKKKNDENTMGRDLRLSVVVMKNEISKFFHGKKMQLFFGLMIAVLVIITAIPYLVGETMSSDSKSILMVYSMFASIVVMLAGILFSAHPSCPNSKNTPH